MATSGLLCGCQGVGTAFSDGGKAAIGLPTDPEIAEQKARTEYLNTLAEQQRLQNELLKQRIEAGK